MVARYTPVVVQAQDYYAFGMLMPQRSYTAPGAGYRYGFNGKENDNEVKGEGNQQDYGERIHDTRLGRFLSTDPLTKSYPMLTPFQYASNSPIWMIDLDGLEGVRFSDVWNGRAHILQFITNPDLGGTATETVSTLNRTINPLFLANNYALKLTTGSDYDGNPIDSRGKSGVVADLGVEIMMWLTLAKIGAPKSSQPAEVQLNQQAKALGNAKPKPTQAAAENATSQTTKSTVNKPTVSGSTAGYNFIRTETPSGANAARTVGANMKIINEGGSLAPIEVASINDKLYIINGHHRVEAAIRTNTSLRYKILAPQEWKAYGYKTESEIVGAAAEASATKVKLDNKIVQKAASTQNP